ncbi:phage tail tube protein [Desulforamulus aquiferis]|uniref:Phage tail tube protein n=1 Tax=Desulforamulus aquiferis TaxID=1397668 RepID=A0AAW7ZE98_9FIRM|nr:phage tail tube protein [Desulforamulus aquiferis]MDO7787125.1 phage tail tube protein [Desulforamulus aquiferis]
MTFLAENTISGKEGRLFLDGEEMANVKKMEATIEKEKTEKKIMGRRWISNKTIGLKGTGTMTLYKATSKFIKAILEYAKTGKDVYFTAQSVLDDKGAERGTERVTLYRINFDSTIIAQLDVDSEGLEEELPFTFEGADLPEELLLTF